MGKRPPVVIPLRLFPFPSPKSEELRTGRRDAELQGFFNEQIDLLLHDQRERMAGAACGEMICRICLSPCNRESKGSGISMYLWKEFKNAWVNPQPLFLFYLYFFIF
ncbi:hypothetical protein ACQJBY_070679 [Aegilops geniculata]